MASKVAADPGARRRQARSSAPDASRQRIVAAAEGVFSARGYDAGTLREVAIQADVPLGLVTYHFRDKLGLYRAVFEARVPEIVQQRLAGLALAEMEPQADRRLELIVKALLVPMLGLRRSDAGRRFATLLAREIADPSSSQRDVVQGLMRPVTAAFLAALKKALPEERRASALWAYGAMIGAMLYMMAGGGRMREVTGGVVDPDDVRVCTDRLVRIALAGFALTDVAAPQNSGPAP